MEELIKQFSYYDSIHKKFEKKIFVHKDLWLPYKFQTIYNAGLHSYTKMATIKDIFEKPVIA